MKLGRILIFISLFYAMPQIGHSQVLISLLFGEKLNSDKIEFGLVGGFNRSYLMDIPEANGENNFNLGFYFHILMKNQSYLSTGVLVKSAVGATGMPTYLIGEEDFDNLYEDGTLTTQIKYFHVPILFHQRFNNRWYLEGGFQLGLRSKAKDIFTTKVLDGDLEYITDVSDDYKRLDAGLLGGIAYKWKKQIKSVSTGINYYYGLMNVSDLPGTTIRNSAIYLYVKVPIGAGKKGTETVVD
jgi:hypothetical protein